MDISQAWKETCRVVLGAEVGALSDYEKFLTKFVEPIYDRKSQLSGRKVTVSRPNFRGGAKFISNDEMVEYNKRLSTFKAGPECLKDLDSMLGAFSEHLYYAGNQISGNCSEVEDSDNIIDSHVVRKSIEIGGGKFIACTSMSRFDEYMFGVSWSAESKYCINCYETYQQTRCFQTINIWTSSDIYYCAGLEASSDCMFSFNRKNSRNLIGNTVLGKEDYRKRKAELLEQVRSELERKKDVVSIFDLLGAKG